MKSSRLFLTIQEIYKKISKDRLGDYSAQACYYILLSFLPFILALINIIHYLPITANDLINLFKNIIPSELNVYLIAILNDIDQTSSVTLLSITAIGLLWSAGKGFMSIRKGLNQIYNAVPKKGWFFQRLFSSIYALIFVFSITAILLLVVFGENLLNFLVRYLPHLTVFINLLRALLNNSILLVPAILTLFFTFMYTFIPSRKSSILDEIPGALLASIGWYLFSKLYSLYVTYFPSHSYTYGSLSTFIFLLVWMYFCIMILFLGAEFNSLMRAKIVKPWTISQISEKIKMRNNS